MIEVIRSPSKVVLVVVSTNASGYSNTLCHVDLSKHWNYNDLSIDSITLKDLPVSLSSFAEVDDGKVVTPSNATVKFASGKVTLSGIKMAANTPLRFFTLDVASS